MHSLHEEEVETLVSVVIQMQDRHAAITSVALQATEEALKAHMHELAPPLGNITRVLVQQHDTGQQIKALMEGQRHISRRLDKLENLQADSVQRLTLEMGRQLGLVESRVMKNCRDEVHAPTEDHKSPSTTGLPGDWEGPISPSRLPGHPGVFASATYNYHPHSSRGRSKAHSEERSRTLLRLANQERSRYETLSTGRARSASLERIMTVERELIGEAMKLAALKE
jgi:hypothetical protein